MTFNDTPDGNEVRKRMIEDEMIYRRDERLGILGVEQGQKPTPPQIAIVDKEQVAFSVKVEQGKVNL